MEEGITTTNIKIMLPRYHSAALLECFSVLPLTGHEYRYDHEYDKRFVLHRVFIFYNAGNDNISVVGVDAYGGYTRSVSKCTVAS